MRLICLTDLFLSMIFGVMSSKMFGVALLHRACKRKKFFTIFSSFSTPRTPLATSSVALCEARVLIFIVWMKTRSHFEGAGWSYSRHDYGKLCLCLCFFSLPQNLNHRPSMEPDRTVIEDSISTSFKKIEFSFISTSMIFLNLSNY